MESIFNLWACFLKAVREAKSTTPSCGSHQPHRGPGCGSEPRLCHGFSELVVKLWSPGRPFWVRMWRKCGLALDLALLEEGWGHRDLVEVWNLGSWGRFELTLDSCSSLETEAGSPD